MDISEMVRKESGLMYGYGFNTEPTYLNLKHMENNSIFVQGSTY